MYLHNATNTKQLNSSVPGKKASMGFSGTNEVKILFVGNVGSGKTAAVNAISEIPVLGTETKATEQDALRRKSSTTIAMEYGQVNMHNTKVHVYGSPGQRRFDFMASILCQGASGMMVLIDNGCHDPMEELDYFLNIHGNFLRTNPAIIAVTHYDDIQTDTGLIDYHQYCKKYGFNLPIIRLDAREKHQVSQGVSKLLFAVLHHKELAVL